MFAYKSNNEDMISLAQKVIEALSKHTTQSARLPSEVKLKISNVVVETQGLIGMIVSGLEDEGKMALLEQYHNKNTGLLSDIDKYLKK